MIMLIRSWPGQSLHMEMRGVNEIQTPVNILKSLTSCLPPHNPIPPPTAIPDLLVG